MRYQKVLCKDWKVSGCCPAGDRCNRWTFCTVIQHTAPCTQVSNTSKFGSSKFCFRWNELPVDGDQRSAPGALGQQRAGRQATCIRGFFFSEVWAHNRGRYMQVGDEVSLVTLWQGTNFFSGKVLTRRSLPSFHFALLMHLHILDSGYWTKGVTKKITRKVNSD